MLPVGWLVLVHQLVALAGLVEREHALGQARVDLAGDHEVVDALAPARRSRSASPGGASGASRGSAGRASRCSRSCRRRSRPCRRSRTRRSTSGSCPRRGARTRCVGLCFSPSTSQNALPNARAPLSHSSYVGVVRPVAAACPSGRTCLRLITPTAPSFLQYSIFVVAATRRRPGCAPAARAIWIAIEPRPPAPPQTSTARPARTTFGAQPCSMRYAVAPTSMYAAAASHVRCGGFGRHWWSCTLVNCAKLPQFVS